MTKNLWGNGLLLFIIGITAVSYLIMVGCGVYYRPVKPQKSLDPLPVVSKIPEPSPVKRPVMLPEKTVPIVKPNPSRKIAPKPRQSNISPSTGSYMAYPAMQQLIQRMTLKGFSREYLNQVFSGVTRDNEILAKVKSPAEAKPWSVYRPIFLTEDRIRSGLGFWKTHESALNIAYQRYGVEPEYIVAIIGVETLFGRNVGKHNVLRSLTTLAMDFPQRSDFYTSELEQFLQLVREEKIKNPSTLKGSYAGAMGMGQFISSSYRNFAVDFNNDKHRDLWNPVDAIGSVANYFSRHGWKRAGDVAVPARILGNSYVKIAHTKAIKPLFSLSQLAQYGVTPANKINSTRVDLLRLQGAKGEEFWVTGDNFYTITRYNHSPKYAMAVYQLAQEIKRRKAGLQ